MACRKAGGRSTVQVTSAEDGRVRVELRLEQVDAVRVTVLDEGEFEILKTLGEVG